MVSAFLNACPSLPTLGHSFVEIVRYYSQDFNPDKMFIDRGEIIVVLPTECPKFADFVVFDPFRIGYNAARNLTRFTDIQELFGATYKCIIDLITKYEAGEEVPQILELVYSNNEIN